MRCGQWGTKFVTLQLQTWALHVWNVTESRSQAGSRVWVYGVPSLPVGWRWAGGRGGKGQALLCLYGGRGEDPPVPGSPSTRILTIGNNKGRTSLLVQWLRLCSPHSGGQSSIPGQETRSHMPQLKISHAARKIRSTILCAAMYIQLSQINSKKKKKSGQKPIKNVLTRFSCLA